MSTRASLNRFVPVAAATLIAASGLLLAGPLNPPAGPIAGTYKTLTEVEPRIAISATNTPGDANSVFRITAPGSYYLTGNITGVAAKHGIEIASHGVTLDLNGFDLLGVAGSLDGISASVVSPRNITIKNGSVRSWGENGIDLFSGGLTRMVLIEDIHASDNGGNGISAGDAGIVRNCHASYNTFDGISGAATVINCVARDNTEKGINCVNGGSITDCAAISNGTYGLYAGNGCTISNSTSRSNGGLGMIAFGDSLISGCSATLNGAGGINGQAGTTIIDCVSSNNTGDGIIVLNNSLVRGNTCEGNTSDGIFISVDANRIEGNFMNNNARGLNVSNAGNVIVRNSCSGNTTTNWLIAANNVHGPILDRTAPASAAVNGNAASSTLGSTDANANYSY